MGLFDDIKEKATEIANVTGKKAGEVYESTKVKLEIADINSNIKTLYKEIGEIVYLAHSTGDDNMSELEDKFAQLDELRAKLDSLDEKQMTIKNLKVCPECGATVPDDSSFCPKCGAKTQ